MITDNQHRSHSVDTITAHLQNLPIDTPAEVKAVSLATLHGVITKLLIHAIGPAHTAECLQIQLDQVKKQAN